LSIAQPNAKTWDQFKEKAPMRTLNKRENANNAVGDRLHRRVDSTFNIATIAVWLGRFG
jgi:hypothetical protein